MADRDFFPARFIGMIISFPGDSQWRLTRKLREKNNQRSHSEASMSPEATSEVYGTFLCVSCHDAGQEAIMRIVMQIPFAGSELAGPREKAEQAKQVLPKEAQRMLHTLEQITEQNLKSGPRLLAMDLQTQSLDDLVPGGFSLFLLLEKLPGLQLGTSFWNFPRSERNRIRANFKSAWIECTQATRYDLTSALEKIFWDASTHRISFYDFMSGCQYREDEDRSWKELKWFAWDLVKMPPSHSWIPTEENSSVMKNWIW